MNFVIDCQILVKKGLNDSRMALLFSWHSKTPPYGAHQNWMVWVKNAKISLFFGENVVHSGGVHKVWDVGRR